MTRYTTDNGTVITDAMVERWAEDAEQGFAHSTVTPVTGRPWETCTEPMKPRTVRMPDSLWWLVEQQARSQHLGVSAFVRQALAHELES